VCRSAHANMDMEFMTADVRDLHMFQDSCFEVVLDKGTLDALLCAADDEGNASKMLQEVRRVLHPGTHFKC
jgi:EEF1A lysine methyltransferase 4